MPNVPDLSDDVNMISASKEEYLPKWEAIEQLARQVSFGEMEIQCSSEEACKGKHEDRVQRVTPPTVPSVEMVSFWFSHNAVKLFSPKHGETPEEAVNDMIERLDKALNDRTAFGCILQGREDALLFLSEMDLAKISVKARHILAALVFAKETIERCERFSFRECCDRAVAHLSSMVPRNQRARGITVSRWFRLFRRTRTFELPAGKKELVVTREAIDTYFGANVEMYNVFLHHMTRYIRTGIHDNLACATAYKYFKETLLPIGAQESGYGTDTFPLYLAVHNLTYLDQRTFEAWFHDILLQHRPTATLGF